jgi:adenylate kinase family enzyme
MNKLYFVIGASGAGKTTATNELENKRPDIKFCYPDKEERIPSMEEMIKEYGSTDNWQLQKTIAWVRDIKEKYLQDKSVILDTQTRYDFIKTACEENNIENFKVILFDCENSIRNNRIHTRGQSELINLKMDDWARYLREDAKKHNLPIIDTTNIDVTEMTRVLEKLIV